MVAVQVLLMNYFLLGLHTDHQLPNDVILPGKNPILTNDVTGTDIAVDVRCPYGCEQCSPINGCLACKPPFYLLLRRDGPRQTATCTRACPRGFYKIKRKKKRGFCAKCMLRGCEECSTRHYCSVCKTGKFRHAGRCYKRCPEGTLISPRSPGLCLPAPLPVPDVYNEIEVTNATTPSPAPSPPGPPTNATSTERTTKRTRKRRKRKRRKEKGKGGRHSGRRHKSRRHQQRGRHRRGRARERRRKKEEEAKEGLRTTMANATEAPASQ
ncbi:R-spondin-1-like isoform X1 [Penaeus indicus]|uniref:R-spondin-1-like isoform X1 n=1 Tax=Penaeus indicus TaxID=29960 RepID=UPI00300CF444